MEDLLKNERFVAAYDTLGRVTLNPSRHTASNAREHSEAVAKMAARLASANGCTDDEVALLTNLGHAHDIGKITGTARPARSLDVLADCGIRDGTLLGLVKWHDTSLPWHQSALRGETPSDKAWRRLTSEVDLRLLCLFMVADRVDAPGGWRCNAATTWFISEARSRGLIGELILDAIEPTMAEIQTNRDLYCFVAELAKRRAGSSVTLQAYLANLGELARRSCERGALSLSEFAHLLQAAFESATPGVESSRHPAEGYVAWEQRIAEQVRDLSEMKEAGTLHNEYRCFGVDAPRGARWYNFDPSTYLECAAAGTFGGWQEGDESGRSYVPGLVAVIDASASLPRWTPATSKTRWAICRRSLGSVSWSS